MTSLFKKLVGVSAASIGRKMSGDMHRFGHKLNQFSTQVQAGAQKADKFLGDVQHGIKKVSRNYPTGITSKLGNVVGIARDGAHVVGKAAQAGEH